MRLLKRERQSEILFHHRFPTSTENVRNACHPFSTKNRWDNNYVMVHNGVVWNDFEVAKKQVEDGIRYISYQPNGSYNDSEVLMYDIARYLEGEVDQLSVEGSIAFIMVQRNKKGEKVALYFGRNSGSPLKLERSPDGFALTSEGASPDIKVNTLYKFDYKSQEFSESPLEIPYYTYSQNSSGTAGNYSAGNYNYGDYCGYGNGYKWSGNNYEDAELTQEARDIADYNAGYSPNYTTPMVEETLDRYGNYGRYGLTDETQEQAESIIIDEIIEGLKYDTYQGSIRDILEFGEILLDELQTKYMLLENKIREDGDLSGEDIDDYEKLDNKILLLTKALNQVAEKQLRLALQATNVRYTPDH